MSSGQIQPLVQRLVGVYNDPSRISRDAIQLLNSADRIGLIPSVSQFHEKEGLYHAKVLAFKGTVPMTYRGGKYNIPVEIFLPPGYPSRPPICFVRPEKNMVLKEGHRHVGSDGMIYMPYLHNWRHYSSNLLDMVLMMSNIFSDDPPCYAKPNVTYNPAIQATKVNSEDRLNHEKLIFIESEMLEKERLKREREMREKEEIEIMMAAAESERIAMEEQKARDTRAQLTRKIQSYLAAYYSEAQEKIRVGLIEQSKLQKGRKTIDQQKKILSESKVLLENQLSQLNQQLSAMSEELARAKERREPDIDELVIPADVRSRQIMDLIVTDASLTDCLHYIDRGLLKGKLTLNDHLKQVRKLAKQQFMVRAHLMKIIRHPV